MPELAATERFRAHDDTPPFAKRRWAAKYRPVRVVLPNDIPPDIRLTLAVAKHGRRSPTTISDASSDA